MCFPLWFCLQWCLSALMVLLCRFVLRPLVSCVLSVCCNSAFVLLLVVLLFLFCLFVLLVLC